MQPFIGQVMLFSGQFAPRGWADCDGALLQITQWTAMFSIVGTTYGGDGRTTFGLPKIAPPTPGMRYVIALEGIYPSRN